MRKIVCEFCNYMKRVELDNLLIYTLEEKSYLSYCPRCKIFQISRLSLKSFFTDKLKPRYSLSLISLIEYINRLYDCKKIEPHEILCNYVGFPEYVINDLISKNIFSFDSLGCNNSEGNYGIKILTNNIKFSSEDFKNMRREQIIGNQANKNIDINVPWNKL